MILHCVYISWFVSSFQPSVDTWIASTFWLLWIMLIWMLVCKYSFFFILNCRRPSWNFWVFLFCYLPALWFFQYSIWHSEVFSPWLCKLLYIFLESLSYLTFKKVIFFRNDMAVFVTKILVPPSFVVFSPLLAHL